MVTDNIGAEEGSYVSASDVHVRQAVPDDAAAIATIYNHYIQTSTATFDTELKSEENRRSWLLDRSQAHPVTVAEREDLVVGFGALSPWGTRCAYHRSVEVSTYVDPRFTGLGVGRALLADLLQRARAVGHHALIGQVVSGNDASIALLTRAGFEVVGTLREVGDKFDRWLDVVLLEYIVPDEDG